jgi:tight adherence protein C
MSSLIPNPLWIWAMSLVALALGVRTRRASAPKERGLPALIRVAATVPMPRTVVDRIAGARWTAAGTAAGLAPHELRAVAASRAGLAACGAVGGVLVGVGSPVGYALAVALGGGGYLWPRHWLSTRRRARRRQIVRELPDVIDLVVICTESGMALDPSLRLAASRLPGTLAREVGITLRELDLGTPRREAYSHLARRVGVPELTGLVGALLQADELGSPIAGVLARQAELLRSARSQDIRDHAARAAPKVQLVVAMVMVPAALLVVLGVLVIQLIGQIGGVVGGAS